MGRPDPQGWQAVSPHLDAALDLAPHARAAWLTSLRATNPAMAASVEAWLAELETAERRQFLEDAEEIAPARSALVGLQLGAYRLISLIGHGGMGSVWLAERSDGRFDARVAVKLLNTALAGHEPDQRFAREGRILATLTHPQIAHLLDAGVSATGQPYLVLEHVDGEPIDCYCNRQRLGIEERIRLFLDVLSPVAHAHANLVVHRDLKPSNVLVTANGRVKLLDFGIAKLLEGHGGASEPTIVTRDGASALTPAYAAPEQITGGVITTATDVYALGLLLYLLLTGRHPTHAAGASAADLLTAIIDRDPPAPSTIVRGMDDDLDTVVGTALKKAPGERYATVTAFAEDLRRYLQDEPIAARADSVTYTAMKFVRRNRTAVTLATLALVALVAGLAGTLTQARRAAHQAQVAEAERARADEERTAATAQRDFARQQLSRAEAINELNEFVMMETAPPGTLLTSRNLLARAEQLVAQVKGGSDESRVEMLVSIGRLYASLGETGAATRVLGEAYRLSRPLSEQSVRAKAACALGSALVKTGDLTQARDLVREGMDAVPNDGRYAIEQIFCHLAASNVSNWDGDGDASVEHMRTAQAIASTSGAISVQVQLEIALGLAEAYGNAGRLVGANQAFEAAHTQVVALGREGTELAGSLLNNWANVMVALGQPREAERMYRRKVQIGSAGGSDERIDPIVWNNLAGSVYMLGRLDEAEALARRAIAGASRGKDEVVANFSRLTEARIRLARGDVQGANAILAVVEPYFARTFSAGHSIFATLALFRARAALARGDRQAATDWADRGVALAEASRRASELVAPGLVRRSAIALASGRTEAAIADAARAVPLELARIGQGAHSSYVGDAYLALGRALAAAGRSPDARAALRSALEHLEPTLGVDHADTRKTRELLASLR